METTTNLLMTSRDSSLPPLKVHSLIEPDYNENPEPFDDPSTYQPDVPIAIDFGSSEVRAGYGNRSDPSHIFPNRLTRYRDRKINRTFTFVGNDTNLEQSLRTQSRSPYDGPIISNWDYVEDILEYTFHHLSVQGHNGISNPIILSEKLATLQSQRENWYQLLFECYGIPQVTFGIDALFSFYANNEPRSSGLVINSGNEDTTIIPVIDGKGIVSEAKRINWGGRQSTDYLSSLLALKYPYFPSKPTTNQFQNLYQDFCRFSSNYDEEIDRILSLEALETENVVIEAPFTEVFQPEKSEEELRIQAEKRKETGKRLQEQARQRRLEKLIQKEEEYGYYTKLKEQLKDQNKKTILSTLQGAGFDDEQDFKKYLNSLEKSLKRARILDVGDIEENEQTETKFDLVDVPDEQLNDEQIKEKRRQRLMKANFEARQRAKEEKLRKQQEEEAAKLRDENWRKEDLAGWVKDKRNKWSSLIKARKEKLKMKEDMKDRKSQIAQKRMKNIATLAEERSRSGTKRSRQQATVDNDPNDTFGANDEDWLVYNDISQNPEALDQLLEEEYKDIVEIEKALLEYDPNFTDEDTLDAQYDWRNSTLHLFLRGPRPHDSEDIHEQHQMHLNVERIRVPEVIFQPTMGGLDQAGIVEICETILLKKFGSSRRELSTTCQKFANNILLTGGNMRIPGIRERIVREFTEILPVGTRLNVRMAKDCAVDAWRGMAKLSQNQNQYEGTYVTRKDYEEYGPDYIKEHSLGNCAFL